MTEAAHIQRLEQKLDRIERLIKSQQQAKSAGTWVSATWVMDITGWNKEKLRMARDQGIIEKKRIKGQDWLYKLESIPTAFIKSTPHENTNNAGSDGSNQTI